MENDETEIFRDPTDEERESLLKWLAQSYNKISREQLLRIIVFTAICAVIITLFFLTKNSILLIFASMFIVTLIINYIKLFKYFNGYKLINKGEVPILISDCTISQLEYPPIRSRAKDNIFTRDAYFKTKYAELCDGPYPLPDCLAEVGSPAIFAMFDTDKLVINEALFTPFMLTEKGLNFSSML